MKNKQILSIGIMRTSALGDIIWTLPMVNRLRAFYPNAKIHYFIDQAFAPLLIEQPGLNIQTIKKPKTISDYLKLRRFFKKFHFDILLCAQANLRINLLYPMIKADRKIGFDKNRGRDAHSLFITESISYKKEHGLDAFLGFTNYLMIPESPIEYSISIDEEHFKWSESITNKPFICIHPQASSPQRTWGTSQYIELIQSLQKDFHIILTGGPGDNIKNEKIIQFFKESITDLSGKTHLKQLAALFKKAELVISPDSGPIHLANAMGTKVVGLYAAVPPQYTGPYGQIQNCVNAYPRALYKFLNKNEDEVSWRTRVKSKDLMQVITWEEVIKKVKEVLSN